MLNILAASHMTDTDDALKVRVEYRYGKMNNNATYSAFQPQTTQLDVLLTNFKVASNNVKDIGGVPMTKIKNKAKEELQQYLKLLNTEIGVAANKLGSDELARAFAEGAGMDVQEPKSKIKNKKVVGVLDMPANFFVENDRQHKAAAFASWEKSKGAVTYIIEEVDDTGKILNTYNTTELFLLIQGTQSEVKKTYQMYAVGSGTSVSETTEPFSVWVR